MRGRLVLAVLSLALGTTSVATTGASAQAPVEDSVTGTFTFGIGTGGSPLRFDVHSGPSGENPRGTVDLLRPDGTVALSADVVCLAVEGNRATVRVNVLDLFDMVFFVEDNDGSGSDRVASFDAGLVPTPCPLDPPAGPPYLPVLSGDIEVVDAQTFPTSKEQCKKGGWRNFPGFKNQGACVSFVATGGRNRPPGSG